MSIAPAAHQAIRLTATGWRRLHDELHALRARRATLTPGFVGAPEEGGDPHGDLARLEARIVELTGVLARAVPIDHTDRVPGIVGVGSRVTVRWADGDAESYTIVGPLETAPQAGRISYQSPVGQALVGRRAGERVEVMTLDGRARLEVVTVD